MHTKSLAAIDLGASSGRCAAGVFDGSRLEVEFIHRFPNGPVEACGHWYWDVLGLYQGIKDGLVKLARERGRDLACIGVDTWGVDFALLDQQGKLAGNPYCARDPHTHGMYAEIFKSISRPELFQNTGIQMMEINSLVQLFAMKYNQDPTYQIGRTFLHIPDLMNYWLTGRKCSEFTNASTSQFMDMRTGRWSDTVIQALGFPRSLFPEIIQPGDQIGPLREELAGELAIPAIPVVATASHDTAAAVVAVPAASGQNFGYISSGTWALLGREISRPVMTEKVLDYNLANEGGAFGTITFLKNIANMWLVQEIKRTWALKGEEYSWDELTQLAAAAGPFTASIDPDDPAFMLPADMPYKVQRACLKSGQPVPQTKGEILRVVFESLAFKYRYVNDRFTALTGQNIDRMHIIGGASRNTLLNQFTANTLNLPVVAGPEEATTLGNLLVQMVSVGLLSSLEEARELVRRSVRPQEFFPQEPQRWEDQYQKFLGRTGLAGQNSV